MRNSRRFRGMKKYDVIYCDPPWDVKIIKRRDRPNQIEMPYPVMSTEDIKYLPVKDLTKDNCSLFLWTIQKYLFTAFRIMEWWGFKYHITITWNKLNGMALAGFNRQTEFLLFGYKGNLDIFPSRKTFPTCVNEKAGKHSEKPQIFREFIKPFGEERIELFARKRVKGFDAWGNEV